MDEQSLILKQEVLSIENDRMDYKTKYAEKSEILSKVMMKFTWVDCETGETDENMFGANGQNDWEKGLGSALTYAERYFLLKYFHIATDEDDIDNPKRKPVEHKPVKKPVKGEAKKKVLTMPIATSIMKGVKEGKVKDIEAYLKENNYDYTPEQLKKLQASK